jgi:cytochrome c nitrite reductase small subunit
MKLLLSALIGILAGAGGYTFYYAKGMSYLSNDPNACANCHIMNDQFNSWQKSGHHEAATCNDCHVPHSFIRKWLSKASNGYHHSEAFTLQNFHEPIQMRSGNAAVVNANCLYCHWGFAREIISSKQIKDEELYCIRCHSDVGHGPSR